MSGRPPVHLRRDGVSLVVAVPARGLPVVLHWGAELGRDLPGPEAWAPAVPRSAVDDPIPTGLLGAGHLTPGLIGSRDGRGWSPRWTVENVTVDEGAVTFACHDRACALELRTTLVLDDEGALTGTHALRNLGNEPYQLTRLAFLLPVPDRATQLLDLTGRWTRERHPQWHRFDNQGTWLRESRGGRPGHDATLLLVAGTAGFCNRSGEVWGTHLAWSGNQLTYAERRPDGRAVLGVAELLEPGEVALGPRDEYTTPPVLAAFSGDGLDGLSDRLHRRIRSRPSHPIRPRPVVLNTWEAVYFDHR
ncbi:MAG: glycoside hydrolase family 36 N-terminal domain-containing protein, partial [Actinomycetes bacterium]